MNNRQFVERFMISAVQERIVMVVLIGCYRIPLIHCSMDDVGG
jgi:hypothetical protein